jgi:serine/threonine-protein kinase
MIAPGEKLGRYHLREPLGSGGMSCVYKAHDPVLDREVAVKILPPELGRDATLRQRFQEEARALGRVEHPNLVRIYAVGQEGLASYYAMELIGGIPLGKATSAVGRLTLEEAVAVIQQVAGALEAVHEAGIVHRDIKPSNIMLDASGRAVLMDFGLARREERQTFTAAGAVLGTPEYMSPEQARGEKADLRSDLYCLGVVFYELLGGRPPFSGKDTIAILRRHVESPPPPLEQSAPDVPESVRNIVERLLAKKADERYPHVREFVSDLVQAAPSETAPERTVRSLLARVARKVSDPTRTLAADDVSRTEEPAAAGGARGGVERFRMWVALLSAVVAVLALAATLFLVMRSAGRTTAIPPEPAGQAAGDEAGGRFQILLTDGDSFEGEFISVREGAEGGMIWTFRMPDGEAISLPDSRVRRMVKRGGDAP